MRKMRCEGTYLAAASLRAMRVRIVRSHWGLLTVAEFFGRFWHFLAVGKGIFYAVN